jgi:O-antigen/teichoic acid export membrane protein
MKIGTVTAVLALIAIVIIFIFLKNARKEILTGNLKTKELAGLIFKTQKFLLKLSLPLLPYYFAIMLISQIDKLFISEFLGKESLGKYSVAYSAGIALTALTNGILSALSPWIMRKVRAEEFGKIKSVLNTVISLFVSAVTVFLCIAPDFFELLAPKNYTDALPIVYIIALIPIPLALAQCMSSIAIAKEKTLGVLICGLIPLILTVLLNYFFTEGSNIFVPALITALGYFTLMILSIANARKITGKYIINVNKTSQKILFMIFISATIFTFKKLMLLRFTIALFTSLYIVYMLRREFSLLKEKRKTAVN